MESVDQELTDDGLKFLLDVLRNITGAPVSYPLTYQGQDIDLRIIREMEEQGLILPKKGLLGGKIITYWYVTNRGIECIAGHVGDDKASATKQRRNGFMAASDCDQDLDSDPKDPDVLLYELTSGFVRRPPPRTGPIPAEELAGESAAYGSW